MGDGYRICIPLPYLRSPFGSKICHTSGPVILLERRKRNPDQGPVCINQPAVYLKIMMRIATISCPVRTIVIGPNRRYGRRADSLLITTHEQNTLRTTWQPLH